jgi:hypothetical protein
MKVAGYEVDRWEYAAHESSSAFGLSFVFGQHHDEILITPRGLYFGGNFGFAAVEARNI